MFVIASILTKSDIKILLNKLKKKIIIPLTCEEIEYFLSICNLDLSFLIIESYVFILLYTLTKVMVNFPVREKGDILSALASFRK